ncbi:MAG TPA: hypothetical protein VHZ52_18185 [Acidobacteriaceae bacterium]|jgi:hypothetical protein|nr:hypothetical protein [Acidobacteriaceae bacterium]
MADVTAAHVSPRTTVKVTLKGAVDVEAIHKIVATIGGIYGCRTCGLLGFDLHLAGDPGDFGGLKGLPGVGSVQY